MPDASRWKREVAMSDDWRRFWPLPPHGRWGRNTFDNDCCCWDAAPLAAAAGDREGERMEKRELQFHLEGAPSLKPTYYELMLRLPIPPKSKILIPMARE